MSVEPRELTSELWTQWQGHVIDNVFPLGRFLGCSDHSGVFQTNSAAIGLADLALKLVPADRLLKAQLGRWAKAGGIVHPHLIRLLKWGECQLDGLPYLYVVTEYADQTLAQVLQGRALTDDEVREMLRPILDVLAFLHGQNLVLGQLKPANILVVGDQLKLASDTIRPIEEGPVGATQHDPSEARRGGYSTADDIWALGMCLFEALTRRLPSGPSGSSEAVLLPPDLSPAFKDIVARCLNPNPRHRPSVNELKAWARLAPASAEPVATIPALAIGATKTTMPEPPPRLTPRPSAPQEASRAPTVEQSQNLRRFLLTAILAGVVIAAMGWFAVHMIRPHGNSTPPPDLQGSPPQSSETVGTVAADVPNPLAALPSKPGRSEQATSTSALHEVIPEVSPSARRTIKGHIKVWVRVIVEPGGAVTAATADRIAHSPYFQRLAIEAAWKWRFPPIEAQSRRVIQIRFDFGRDQTTGRALTLD